jgi:hypothetical protein
MSLEINSGLVSAGYQSVFTVDVASRRRYPSFHKKERMYAGCGERVGCRIEYVVDSHLVYVLSANAVVKPRIGVIVRVVSRKNN